MKAREIVTACRHCKNKETETGTRGGCGACGKVKHNANGRKNDPKKATTPTS